MWTGSARRCVIRPDGRRQIVDLLIPGDFFGFSERNEYDSTVEAVASFRVTRDQIEVMDRKPFLFAGRYVPSLAVAKKALPNLLAKCCPQDDGLLIVAQASASFISPHAPTAANESE